MRNKKDLTQATLTQATLTQATLTQATLTTTIFRFILCSARNSAFRARSLSQ
ncbi:MAG: pentapeptide repeat-containing protein [Eubacteriales bacterium]